MRAATGRGPADRPPWLAARLWAAWTAILWERIWAGLWPASGVLGLFLALALADLLPTLPGWLHLTALVAFAATFGAALWRNRAQLVAPDRETASRRLERESGLAHRPLSVLDDALAAGVRDPGSVALWRAHRKRMREVARRLRVGVPAPGLARLDPLAFRTASILVLAVVATTAWAEAPSRIERALTPVFGTSVARPATLDLWIAPPAYTGRNAVTLKAAEVPSDDEDLPKVFVPAGSVLTARLDGGRGVPRLALDTREVDFVEDTAGGYGARTELTTPATLRVTQGNATLGAWRVDVVPDAVPVVAFIEFPSHTSRAALKVDYGASDDYGLEWVRARIEPVVNESGQQAQAPSAAALAPLVLDLPMQGLALDRAQGFAYFDLTPHPWAGMPATIVLEAADGIGQIGRSDRLSIMLPAREFKHPVARAIIAERRHLTLRPEAREQVALALHVIAARGHPMVEDAIVFLALSAAGSRLVLDPSPDAIGEVEQLLWDTALQIEDGDLSMALRELREIHQRLAEALARGASDAELETLMDELQEAMDRYLQALVADMQRRGPSEDDIEFLSEDNFIIDRDELQRFVERARELARSGARDRASELLSQLQEMLENLRAGLPQMMRGQDTRAESIMRELRELIERQQGMLDKTYKQWQERLRGNNTLRNDSGLDPGDRGLAIEQDDLRQILGELMRQFGELIGRIPDPLSTAEWSMREAAQALLESQLGNAIRPQGRALDELRRGGQEALAELIEQMAAGGRENRLLGEGLGDGRDPLGRPIGTEGAATGDVRIPEQAEMKRVREILDELHRRARQRHRPQVEREYIERLLRRF